MAFDLGSILQGYAEAQKGFNPNMAEWREKQQAKRQQDMLFETELKARKMQLEEAEDKRQVRDFALFSQEILPLVNAGDPESLMRARQITAERNATLQSQKRDNQHTAIVERLLSVSPDQDPQSFEQSRQLLTKLGSGVIKKAYQIGALEKLKEQEEVDSIIAKARTSIGDQNADPESPEMLRAIGKVMGIEKDGRTPTVAELYARDIVKDWQTNPEAYWAAVQEFNKNKTPSTTINMPNEPGAIDEALGEPIAKEIMTRVDEGNLAITTERSLLAMKGLLKEGVSTGTLQPLIKTVQGMASDLGVDINKIMAKEGIKDLGSLAQKEEFERLSSSIIIDGFAKFKGNLNAKEVDLAMNAFANLGRSEDANKMAYASGMASAQLAKAWAKQYAQIRIPDEWRALKERQLSGTADDFIALRDKYYAELGPKSTPIVRTQEEYDALPSGTEYFEPDGKPYRKP